MTQRPKVIETDVLVVGAGVAGARAALAAHEAGAKVTLAVKGELGIPGARGGGATGGGATRCFHLMSSMRKYATEQEEVEGFFRRSIQAGLGLADRELAKTLAYGAAEAKRDLSNWGLVLGPTNPTDPNPIECNIVPMPGMGNLIRAAGDIRILQYTMLTDLLTANGACVGAVAIDEHTGESCLIRAGSTILATGGYAQLYRTNFHASCVTADGHAMGYEAGAELMNMEFSQMIVGPVYPMVTLMPRPIWGLFPRILNSKGAEFIQGYLPAGVSVKECMQKKLHHGPYSVRDITKYLEIAMVKETKAGRANEHHGFRLEVPEGIQARPGLLYPEFHDYYKFRGVDWWNQKYVEINVNHHCSTGGLKIDVNGETAIAGLYALGETATGPYGADRLGGAMQTFCLVFGARAGRHAAGSARARGRSSFDSQQVDSRLERIARLKQSQGDRAPYPLTQILKRRAWEELLAVRTHEGLTGLLAEIEELRETASKRLLVRYPSELIAGLELQNLLLVGEIVTRAALMRTESRGSHYREDFPEQDDMNWQQNITVKKSDRGMKLGKLKIDERWKNDPAELGWWG